MTNEIYHHGIKGQRLGVRRYRNPDGTLTNAGKKRTEHKKMKKYDSYKHSKGSYFST